MAFYNQHSKLVLPNDDTFIWRYMDFFKLESMLQRNSIFFSRADKQTDNLEGEYPSNMLIDLEKQWGIIKSDDGKTYSFYEWHTKKEIPSRLLSCWSVASDESKRRWSKYTTIVESIAIRSTIGKLKGCFTKKGNGEPVVNIGKIRYGDNENQVSNSYFRWDFDYFLYPFFAKKESYRWENEVRAIVNLSHKKQIELGHSSNGCFIEANLHELINSIWIHPRAGEEFYNRVRILLNNLTNSKIPVYQSSWEYLND